MELKELYQTLVETEKDFQSPSPPPFFLTHRQLQCTDAKHM